MHVGNEFYPIGTKILRYGTENGKLFRGFIKVDGD